AKMRLGGSESWAMDLASNAAIRRWPITSRKGIPRASYHARFLVIVLSASEKTRPESAFLALFRRRRARWRRNLDRRRRGTGRGHGRRRGGAVEAGRLFAEAAFGEPIRRAKLMDVAELRRLGAAHEVLRVHHRLLRQLAVLAD